MTNLDPEDVIEESERQKDTIREHFVPAVEWFLEEGGMGERSAVVGDLAAHLDVDEETANLIVGHLVSDDADPVQQVVQPKGGRFVGVIDHAEHDWFYAFDRYDDVDGRERRAVCAHCVHEERAAAAVTHFTRAADEYDLESARAALAVHYHVDHAGHPLADVLADLGVDPSAVVEGHGEGRPEGLSIRDVTRRLDTDPALDQVRVAAGRELSVPDVDVKPGASLVSGTTIGGNESWHAGNDGSGSNLDADLLDGTHAAALDRFVHRYDNGGAVIQRRWSDSITASNAAFSNTYTITVTPGTTASLAFLETRVQSQYDYSPATVRTVERNGSSIETEIGMLVSNVSSGDSFRFRFHFSSTPYGSVTLYGGLSSPEVISPRTT